MNADNQSPAGNDRPCILDSAKCSSEVDEVATLEAFRKKKNHGSVLDILQVTQILILKKGSKGHLQNIIPPQGSLELTNQNNF